MVKILRSPVALEYYKIVYSEPLGTKLKFMWSKFQESSPIVAYFAPPSLALITVLFGVATYLKATMNPVPKYYFHYVVFRPDDPEVPFIRKDNSLKINLPKIYNSFHYEPV
ncbi:unnamed protein product [Xylocopa violacea]|uniref:Uncharacterized protein n=1 Tax=Xylocopa violacea TaxID=135666 RepID=A0ABP1N8G3_XYLVO